MPPTLLNPVFSESTRIARRRPAAVTSKRHRSRSPEQQRKKGHKPTKIAALKRDGSNYPLWHVRIGAALRFLDIPSNAENLDATRDQLAIDLLLDSVEDDLVQYVSPAGHHATAFEVLQVFSNMFSQANESHHASLTAQLWTLSQKQGEDIQSYSSRASALQNQLLRSGGSFSAENFLQCFERGVAAEFKLTVRLLRQGPPSRVNFPCLLGDLLAEEASIELEAARLKKNFHGVAGAIVDKPAGKPAWKLAKPGAPPAAKAPRGPDNPNCWNCNGKGHTSKDCPEPRVRPWPHAPEGFTHKRAAKPAAA